jgi:hypothetical protein
VPPHLLLHSLDVRHGIVDVETILRVHLSDLIEVGQRVAEIASACL